MSFDSDAPLPGAPDPWAASRMPAWREGPPYVMTEMIAAEPALTGRLVRRLQSDPALERIAEVIRHAAQTGLPVTTTGCGTSQHAAMAVSCLIADGLGPQPGSSLVRTVQAFELAGRSPDGGVVIAISHEGGTDATNQALRWAGGPDGPTALITVGDHSPGAAIARDVLTTEEQDQSWCHTVGYLSPVVAGACLQAVLLGTDLSAEALERQVAAGADEAAAERLADGLSHADRLVTVGSGADYAAARELALKVEEGARLPAVAHELEAIRHGHLASANEHTGLVVFLTDAEGRDMDVRERAATVLRAATELGMPSVLIGSSDMAEVAAAASVGSQLVPLYPNVSRPVAAILGMATPLQLLTERLARARGTNPDTIGREDPRQAAAAEA